MREMTSIERMTNLLRRRPIDRIGLYEHFWGDTRKVWAEQRHIAEDEDLADHFGFDMEKLSPFNLVADLDFEPEVVEEAEETVLIRDGDGALLRRHKLHDATPEHVDFLVKERAGWESYTKPRLAAETRRIRFDEYRKARDHARERGRFFCWAGVHVFEIMKNVAGHEHMLVGMALDPEWVKDMVMTYARLTVELQEILFAQEGLPDGIWYYEDMGFKAKPFMSPRMYREIVQPGHKLTMDYAKSLGLPVIMHSCGYVAPLVPGMLAAGIDCLQVIEVKAGMDLIQLYRDFGEHLSFMGGMDVRVLYGNDRAQVDRELEEKIPIVKGHYGYALHSDHSIPNTVDYETYRYFVERGLQLGAYDGGRT
jgi:uroporphyrinogen decarboxylase